jgi:flagellar assembly factor FliW
MIRLTGTRFGEIEIDDAKTIVVPRGLLGFPDAQRYVLLPRPGKRVAWLQSLDVPELAFPVVDGAAFPNYPRPPARDLAREAGLGANEVAVLIIVMAPKGQGLLGNMLAPLIVDLETRACAQVVLDPRLYSATAPL